MFKKILLLIFSPLVLIAGQGQFAKANGIQIWYEPFGNKEDPAVLLLMGGCCQGVLWHEGFCKRLAQEGFYVIRYDHRDTGQSTCFDFGKSPYSLNDMAGDAVSVLDAAGVEKAHLFGVSLGGLLAELVAGYYPEKVHTLLLMGGTCDIRPMNRAYAGLPMEENALYSPPSPVYLSWMQEYMKLSPQTEEQKLAQRLEGWNRLNGQKIPLNEEINRKIHQEFLLRNRYPQGILNHIMMLRDEQSEELVRIAPSMVKVPTVILHGTEDPIFPPDHGEALNRAIEHSEYFLVEGMGHVPNDQLFDLYIDILKRQALEPL
ncbi:MAG: alpha/beta hydrolase [Verrucomicrobia bacterium]|nr:alpha/beta hydrolase [Verrucomicrobiota bacterium]